MKLGISAILSHSSPEEWAKKHKDLGLEAVVFPCNYKQDIRTIDAYVSVCNEYKLQIAEVKCWCNVMAANKDERANNIEYCVRQLELAEYVGANCCLNVSGAKGEVWDAPYPENLTSHTYDEVVETTQRIIDAVHPKSTYYTLEPMPWMYPTTPEEYLKLITDINRPGFAVHMDMVNMISSPDKYLDNAAYTQKAFQLLGKYIKSCHIKDVLLQNKLTVQMLEVPCGDGGFDLKNYISLIDSVSVDMPVIIEHLTAFEEYVKAIDYLNKLKEDI